MTDLRIDLEREKNQRDKLAVEKMEMESKLQSKHEALIQDNAREREEALDNMNFQVFCWKLMIRMHSVNPRYLSLVLRRVEPNPTRFRNRKRGRRETNCRLLSKTIMLGLRKLQDNS